MLAAKDGYKDALARKGQELSCNILNELTKLGLTNQGILTRDSEADERYPNQVIADYYAIIRGGVENDMLTVLVEHAFIDSNSDYKAYLSSDEKLKSLACADATGIARYYQLVKKSQEDTVDHGKCLLEPLKEYKEKLVHVVDGNVKHNEISYKTYYGEESKQLPYDMETFDQITKDINENVISMHISCD